MDIVVVCMLSRSVMFDSLQPHGLSPTRLLCSQDFPGKNTGADCHFLLQGSSQPRDQAHVSCISPTLAGGFFTTESQYLWFLSPTEIAGILYHITADAGIFQVPGCHLRSLLPQNYGGYKTAARDFPGDPVARNLVGSLEDTSLLPGLGNNGLPWWLNGK